MLVIVGTLYVAIVVTSVSLYIIIAAVAMPYNIVLQEMGGF